MQSSYSSYPINRRAKFEQANALLQQREQAERTRVMLMMSSYEDKLHVIRRENDTLTLQLASYVRRERETEAQAMLVSGIWAAPPSPTHFTPIPDENVFVTPPRVSYGAMEVPLEPGDKPLNLPTVVSNMGYCTKESDLAHLMGCFYREYMKRHGTQPLPKFYYMPTPNTRFPPKKLTLFSESDLPILTRVIKNYGSRREPLVK